MAIDQKAARPTSPPIVSCPMCGAKMRISSAEPNGNDPKLRIKFECECGFEYRMSERIANRIVRDDL